MGKNRKSFEKGRSDRRAEPDLQGREPDGGHPPVRPDGPGSDGPAPQGQGSRRELQGRQESAHLAAPRARRAAAAEAANRAGKIRQTLRTLGGTPFKALGPLFRGPTAIAYSK